MVDIIDDLVKTVVKIAADQIASILRAISAIQTNLGRNHRHRMLGTNAVVINNARLGIQARGDINGYDTIGAFIDRRNPDGERRTQIPVETGTKNGINNNIGLIDQNLEFVTRGADANVHIAAGSTTSNMTCQSSRNLIRLNRRNDIHVHTLMAQDIGGNPTVAAIITKTDQNENPIGIELQDLVGGKLTR